MRPSRERRWSTASVVSTSTRLVSRTRRMTTVLLLLLLLLLLLRRGARGRRAV